MAQCSVGSSSHQLAAGLLCGSPGARLEVQGEAGVLSRPCAHGMPAAGTGFRGGCTRSLSRSCLCSWMI